MSMGVDQGSRPASGIPRLSRLPIPHRSARESVNASRKPCISLVAPKVSNAQGTSQQTVPASGCVGRRETTAFSTVNTAPGSETGVASKQAPLEILLSSSGNVVGTPEEVSHSGGLSCESDGKVAGTFSDPAGLQPETPRTKRRPRPSLLDRTIETLSQMPSSPSSNRRRSSFFNADTASPMRPPLRPASAMSNSISRPSSPTKRPPVPAIPTSFVPKSGVRSMPGRRSMTQPAGPATCTPIYKTAYDTKNPSTPGLKCVRDHESSEPNSRVSQTSAPRGISSSSKPPLRKPLSSRQHAVAKSNENVTASRKAPYICTSSKTASSSSSRSQRSSNQSSSTEVDANAKAQPRDFPKSSAALRGAIAKAKREIASRKASADQRTTPVPDARLGSRLGDNLLGLEKTGGLSRERMQAALLSGHLNVAAMELQSIPSEIKQMYNASEDTNVAWSECVDLTKFIAADNKLERLEDDFFPDATNSELEDTEGADYNGQLRGLETLDMHNNLLREVPIGLRRLQKLHSLNLSGNKLGEHALGIICQIGDSLTELRMSENELSGRLSDHIQDLPRLQVLDLHGNKISELPEGFRNLIHLRVLNLAQNKISSIQSQLLASLALSELIVSGNLLSGVLFPPQTPSITKSLKRLDVSYNALEAIATTDIALPSIQSVNLSGNRFKSLPDISSWTELLTFAVAENLVSEIPPGLVMLRKLRTIDLSNNNISKLDDGIAYMEDLTTINLAGNPLRERKYITMSTDDLKADLRKRGLDNKAALEVKNALSVATSSPGGILDLSSRSLSDFELPEPNIHDASYDIRLHHNAFNAIPASLLSHTSISATLKSLDMSHNALQLSYLSASLSLPQLKDLSLASCHLKSLEGLKFNLRASNLTVLNLSTNHLSGALPQLRTYFPTLTTLLASDNHFSVLDVNAVKGLTTLDIRNNEIEHLEPRLGLLGGKAGLKCLEVSRNKFRVPRWDVLEKGTEAVLRYLRGRVPLEELEDDAAGGWDVGF